MKNNKGFSLVELIVVIAIMAILAAVAIPTFATFIDKANKASDESFVNDLEYALELALIEDGKELNEAITITTVDGAVTEVKLGTTVIYGTVDEKAVDTYSLDSVIDFDYSFKKYEAHSITIATDGAITATPIPN
ncbi:MAG: type II secretion system protein [Clostridia bacterium]|nr:type II secretion system protein [Clostridia bacterium]